MTRAKNLLTEAKGTRQNKLLALATKAVPNRRALLMKVAGAPKQIGRAHV